MSQKTFEDYLKATPAERRKMNMNEILGEERLANIRKQMLNEIKDTLQEDKELLLKDLCARLPYGVKGRYCLYDSEGNLTDWGNEPEIVENIDFKESKIWTEDTVQGYYLDEFKPYLRPLSSMTEEEENIVYNGHVQFWEREDYCNKHHLDYRGLIEKGLALEAPDDMYKQ